MLLCLIAAARHENFHRAAQDIALTESAVSRQIAALEAFLGVRLFTRVRQRVRLTDAGKNYAAQVSAVIEQIEHDVRNMRAQAGGGGIIELAVLPTLASQWLIPRLPDFLRLHPDITLNLTSQIEMFRFEETKFDAAIHFGGAIWPNAASDFLFGEQTIVVCHPSLIKKRRRLHANDLEQYPLIQLRSRPDEWRNWFSIAGLGSSRIPQGPMFDLHTMVISAVQAGLGFALLPRFLIEDRLQAGDLVSPLPHVLPNPKSYYLTYPESKQTNKALLSFRDWLMGQI